MSDPYASFIPGKLKLPKAGSTTKEALQPVQQISIPKEFKQTAAEESFHHQRLERLAMQKQKQPQKTHYEAINEFNKMLENTSEHYDIPKVGPG